VSKGLIGKFNLISSGCLSSDGAFFEDDNTEINRPGRNMSNKQFTIPSMEQRKSQINLLNYMEKDRRDSQEFTFPDSNLLHRRRQSADYNSATQSEDDESVSFEVSWKGL
jgi:hypothetical protein